MPLALQPPHSLRECIHRASENLSGDKTYFSGPNHSALGELAYSETYRKVIINEAKKQDYKSKNILNVFVAPHSLSKAVGQKRRNKILIKEELGISDVRFAESDAVKGLSVKLLFE